MQPCRSLGSVNVVAADNVEYLELLDPSGDTTKWALYRVFEGDEHRFSVKVALTGSAARLLPLNDEEICQRLPEYGRRQVERRLALEPGWEAANLGRTEVELRVSTDGLDVDEFLAAGPTE